MTFEACACYTFRDTSILSSKIFFDPTTNLINLQVMYAQVVTYMTNYRHWMQHTCTWPCTLVDLGQSMAYLLVIVYNFVFGHHKLVKNSRAEYSEDRLWPYIGAFKRQ